MKHHAHLIAAAALSLGLMAESRSAEVAVCTDVGAMTIEVYPRQAPRHAANFLEYVDQGYYSGTVFHRVIPGFMVQAGGYDRGLLDKGARPPLRNESRNGLRNERGTVAAARTDDPHSAQAQFYINLDDNARLDATDDALGYTVFGEVTSGMEIAEEIAALPTRAAGPFQSDVPQPLIGITSMARLNREALAELPEEGRAEALRDRISAAIDESRYAEALTWIGHYRATCAEMTPEMLLAEARTAAALLRVSRARAVLDEYFAAAGRDHEGWAEALELYGLVAPDTEPAFVAQQFGDCAAPAPPQVPDGTTADRDTMVAGQQAVRAFVNEGDVFLECLSEVIDGGELDEADHTAAVQAHNRMVTSMENVAEAFNAQIQAFESRE